jgi:hypothetical protein
MCVIIKARQSLSMLVSYEEEDTCVSSSKLVKALPMLVNVTIHAHSKERYACRVTHTGKVNSLAPDCT